MAGYSAVAPNGIQICDLGKEVMGLNPVDSRKPFQASFSQRNTLIGTYVRQGEAMFIKIPQLKERHYSV